MTPEGRSRGSAVRRALARSAVPLGAALAALAVLAPGAAPALEPRFDHRDTHGALAEFLIAHDTVAMSGRPTVSSGRPSARLGWGFDVSGTGDELSVAATMALRSFDDPGRDRVLVALDARYRGYFGTEELKTFFDVGAWAPVRSRIGVGPLVGLGLAYDVSHYTGFFVAGAFATTVGATRIASLAASAGVQVRFDLPWSSR